MCYGSIWKTYKTPACRVVVYDSRTKHQSAAMVYETPTKPWHIFFSALSPFSNNSRPARTITGKMAAPTLARDWRSTRQEVNAKEMMKIAESRLYITESLDDEIYIKIVKSPTQCFRDAPVFIVDQYGLCPSHLPLKNNTTRIRILRIFVRSFAALVCYNAIRARRSLHVQPFCSPEEKFGRKICKIQEIS